MQNILHTGHQFTTIYGRNLVAELPAIARRPYLVVTMPDLWEKFSSHFDERLAGPYFVHTLDGDELELELDELPAANSVIGLGGGQAIDVAKFIAWAKRLPLFQVPTSMSVNAPFGHRAGLRYAGRVKYVGYVRPEAVYVDFDVIQQAPALLNRSGVCEILCYHTAHADWRLADARGKTEPQWPYDQRLVDAATKVFDDVWQHLDDIRGVNQTGIRALMNANRWGGAAYHNAGWNPRHIEGVDHFVFYALEYYTGKKFIHGQPVCLGVYIGSLLHDHQPAEILQAIRRVGVDIRPEAMDLTWDDVGHALKQLKTFVREAGLWYTIADEATITDDFVAEVRERVTAQFGAWPD